MADEKQKIEKELPVVRTIWKVALLKKNNRRIYIYIYKESDGTHMILIHTKRLIGNWKDRKILKTEIAYGMETFSALRDMFNIIMEDFELKKAFNRELGQINKTKWNCLTSIGNGEPEPKI